MLGNDLEGGNPGELIAMRRQMERVDVSLQSAQAQLIAANAEKAALAAKVAMLSAQLALHTEKVEGQRDRDLVFEQRSSYARTPQLSDVPSGSIEHFQEERRTTTRTSGLQASSVSTAAPRFLTSPAAFPHQAVPVDSGGVPQGPVLPPPDHALNERGEGSSVHIRAAALSSPNPRVSIIVFRTAQSGAVERCLESLGRHTANIPLEVLIPEEAGARALNAAAATAQGRYVVFLDSHVDPMVGWLDSLLEVFESRTGVAIVGPKILFSDRRLKSAGGLLWRDGTPIYLGRFDDADLPQYNHVCETDYVPGVAMLVDTKLFHSIRGFDERFLQAGCAAADLALKARQAGFKVYYQPGAVVIHDDDAVSHDVSSTYDFESQRSFYEKWKESLNRNVANPDFRLQYERRFQSAQLSNLMQAYQRIDAVANTLLEKVRDLCVNGAATQQSDQAPLFVKDVEAELEKIRKGVFSKPTCDEEAAG